MSVGHDGPRRMVQLYSQLGAIVREEWETFECKVPRDGTGYPVDQDGSERLGFLQLCIERRFHFALRHAFETFGKLGSHAYWLHTDFGGTPKMRAEEDRAAYAYENGARVMGWTAHGTRCGAFTEPGPTDDDAISKALAETFADKPLAYPKAEHWVLFATAAPGTDMSTVLVRYMGPVGPLEH